MPTTADSRPRILNVDDVQEARLLKTSLLQNAGFAVIEATTGLGALRALDEYAIDLVLLDVNLQDIDGFEVCRRLRANGSRTLLPVILTAAASFEQGDWIRGLAVGADTYLTQPTDPEVMIGVVRALLGRTAAEQQHRAERDIAVEARARTDQRHRALFEHAPYGILHTTMEGRIIDVNPALTKILGYATPEALVEVGYAQHLYRDPTARAAIIGTLQAEGVIRDLEVDCIRADGSVVTVSAACWIVEDTGEIETFLEDITERKGLEERFRQAQKMEAIGRLAGGIAHDFNNLLTAILGYSDLVLEQIDADKPIHADLLQIKTAANRAAALTRQLLAFSRRQILRTEPLSLNGVITNVRALLLRMIGEDVEIETVLDPDLGDILGDKAQLEQVLMNLAVNARDAMPMGGRLRFETANLHVDEEFAAQHFPMTPGDYAKLSVSDTGVGITREVKAHLFEPFFTTKDVGKGTGLGLATVYGIVKQLSGFVWVTSEPGAGATFEVLFPLTRAQREPLGTAEPTTSADIGSETVLLVEDDGAVRTFAASVLKRHGYQVMEATCAEDALRLADALPEPVSLLLTDIIMPGIAGTRLAEMLKARQPALKVLYMSGYTEDAFAHGEPGEGVDLIEKPFTARSLLSRVRWRLDR